MKTTIDLPQALLEDARAAAAQRGWTVRLIFEQSLRSFLARESAESPAAPFRLQHTVVKGKGLVNPGLSFASMLEQSGVNRQPSVKRKK